MIDLSKNIVSYVSHMEQRHPIALDATGMVFFLYLCFLVVVADNASLLMHAQELPYMTSYGHKLYT